MATRIVDCLEFDEISLRTAELVEDGELIIDKRIAGRGYLSASLKNGQIVFRSDRFVGLIPITRDVSVRVRPRASIANLSYMIARSGVVPVAIPSFSRGYLPRFETGVQVHKLYARSLLEGVERVVAQGLAKTYIRLDDPPPWRGRLLVSQTVRRYASKNIRYRHDFEQTILTQSTLENVALMTALQETVRWLEVNDRRNDLLPRLRNALIAFGGVRDWVGQRSDLVRDLGRRLGRIAPQLAYYRDPCWTAFLLLQSSLPDVGSDGSVTLDSLIVDVSKVFEAYVRKVLGERATSRGWNIQDGNHRPSRFFTDNPDYSVHPDILVREGGTTLGVLDAKYKLAPKEADRYEVLSFMDAADVNVGGFICPSTGGERSTYIGVTKGGRSMSSLRFDLGAHDPEAEADRLFANVARLIDGNHDYI